MFSNCTCTSFFTLTIVSTWGKNDSFTFSHCYCFGEELPSFKLRVEMYMVALVVNSCKWKRACLLFHDPKYVLDEIFEGHILLLISDPILDILLCAEEHFWKYLQRHNGLFVVKASWICLPSDWLRKYKHLIWIPVYILFMNEMKSYWCIFTVPLMKSTACSSP